MLKGIKFILACILSLTIVYVGAGANLSHCRCAHNTLAKSDAMGQCHCNELNGKAGHKACCMHKYGMQNGKCSYHCRANCCRTVIYKVDLQQNSQDTGFNAPVSALLPDHSLLACNTLPTEICETYSYSDPPGPSSSRFYLNLYSTLLI
ncbi:hypothetical protein [uncultured Bacteroides sp.]|uniref:hypothetical protein n=1 Tax=uncultured Bacteroides sp. TaxID=162156 RepID=UPI002AAC0A25|nr:hypothetical protein [uncultured Bacteroides sp.]